MTQRKPAVLKLVAGNPGRRPIPVEPVPIGPIGTPPTWISGPQKTIWKNAIAGAPAGILTSVDRSVLLSWVIALDDLRLAQKQIAKYGLVVKDPITGAPVRNPFLEVRRQAQTMILAAAKELGFSPIARTRIAAGNEPDKRKNTFSGNRRPGGSAAV